MSRGKRTPEKEEILAEPVEQTNLPGSYLRSFHAYEHWRTIGYMFKNYSGIDASFDDMVASWPRAFALRWFIWPVYFWLRNEGFGLWINPGGKGRPQLAGQIYLQFRKMTTHINDVEVNRAFQGQGLSHTLLALAEQQARSHNKQFLTLAVTLSNTRALNLYRQSGFLEQHHRYFYLARPWWSESPQAYSPYQSGVKLVPLERSKAKPNLLRFFKLETRAAEPVVSPVLENLYRPTLPTSGEGFSFALYENDRIVPCGHANFFDWHGRGRWQIYLDPSLWGTATERAFFEAFLYQSRGYTHLGIIAGTAAHHQAALAFTREMGLVERDTDRSLMIRPLT